MKVKIISLFLIICFSLLAQDNRQGISLKGTDLQTLTEAVQRRTKKQFLFANATQLRQRRIWFLSDDPLDEPEKLFKVYEAILQMNGFALIPVGEPGKEIYKIVKVTDPLRIKYPAKLIDKVKVPHDQYVTRLFKIKYVSASEIRTQLQQMGIPMQQVIAIESAGVLLVTDYDHNIKRIEKIIELADIKLPDVVMEVIPLKNALATNVAKIMNELVETLIQVPARRYPARPRRPYSPRYGRPERERVKIVEDLRTNSIIILATPDRMGQLKEIVRKLDEEVAFETSGIFVYMLKHAIAKDMVEMLSKVFEERARPGQPARAATTTPTTFAEQFKPIITADERTNSVIVVSDRNTYKMIERLLRRLDKRRPQVLIKSSIVEVKADDSFDFGAELTRWIEPRKGKYTVSGRTQFGYSTLIDTDGDGILDAVVPELSDGIMLGLFKDNLGKLPVLIKALQRKAHVSILDEPEIITQDNAGATITIADQAPVMQTQYFGPQQIPVRSFREYVEAKTTLTISPHISETQEVQLTVDISIEKFTGEPPTEDAPPPKTTRQLKIDAIKVPNGRTIVIGGIVTQDSSRSTDQVPLLGDIPIVGEFFKRTRKKKLRKTLYIFLTPYILYEEKYGDMFNLTDKRKEDIETLREEKLKLPFKPERAPKYITSFRFKGPKE